MSQTLRPNSTISNVGPWQVQGGATAHAVLAEASGVEVQYVNAVGAVTATLVVGIDTGADPLSNANHVISIWMRSTGAGGLPEVGLKLMEGVTERANPIFDIDSTLTLYTYTLSGAEADSITDYSALRFELVTTLSKGEFSVVESVWLTIPDAPTEQDSLLTLGCS